MIFVDTREKARAITKILAAFDARGVKYASTKLYVGDYQDVENPLVVVDRKQNLLELVQNVCQDHKRFIAEIERAREAGITIIFLVEHGGSVKCLEDVRNWVNPRLNVSPLAMSGERLYKVLNTISAKYGVSFQFCDKRQTGARILELIGAKRE